MDDLHGVQGLASSNLVASIGPCQGDCAAPNRLFDVLFEYNPVSYTRACRRL
jgi:hypothetical protein